MLAVLSLPCNRGGFHTSMLVPPVETREATRIPRLAESRRCSDPLAETSERTVPNRDDERLSVPHSRWFPHKRHAGSTGCLRFSFVGGKRKKSRKLRSPCVSRIWTKYKVQMNRIKVCSVNDSVKQNAIRRVARIQAAALRACWTDPCADLRHS